MAADDSTHPAAAPPGDNRRSFITIAAALVAGAVATLTPLAVGLAAFFSPLFRKARSSDVRLALMDQVPDDGVPRIFPVVTDRVDAWNRYPQQKIGAVYLIRQPGEKVPLALTAKCPHAGCIVGYARGADQFQCPCHTSAFKLDGQRLHGDAEVAPRGMDPLQVDIRTVTAIDGQTVDEVWVDFVNFQTGRKERIPTT